MTSLQKQLAVIASTSHNELDLKAHRAAHAKSILFESAVAANQSFDFLYQLCLEGFEELCNIDTRFLYFGRSLFSPQSRFEDRMRMTAQENQHLDHILENFLALAGGRLLLQPTLKAVEWLVRRFRIHELNTGLTILAFLPHHATPLFATLLSILPTQLPPPFKFLHTYMSTLANPPLSAIVHNTIHNPGFFTAFNNHVLSVCRLHYQSPSLLSLWATITAQTIDSRLSSARSGRTAVQNERTEELLTQLLPVLNEGFSLRKAPELVLACYLVTIVLVSKSDLDEDTLDALLSTVVSSWNLNTFVPGIGCAAVIAQRKERMELPLPTIKAVLKFHNIGFQLCKLSEQQNVSNFTKCLMHGALEMSGHDALVNISAFYREVTDAKLVDQTTIQILKSLLEDPESQIFPGNKATQRQNLLAILSQEISEGSLGESHEEAPQASNPKLTELGRLNNRSVKSAASNTPEQLNISSFLAVDSEDSLVQVLPVFADLSTSVNGAEQFQQLRMWSHKETIDQKLLVSFYLRVLCSSKSANLRSRAVEHLTGFVTEANGSHLDIINLLPHVMIILSDEAKQVRKAGIGLVETMLNQSTIAHQDPPRRWNFYGDRGAESPSCAIKSLRAFLRKHVHPALEECSADPERIHVVFQTAMHGPSNKDQGSRRMKSAQRAEIMSLFCWHIQTAPILEIKHRLLQSVNKAEKIAGKYRSLYLLPCIKSWVSETHSREPNLNRRLQESANLAFMDAVHPRDQDAVRYAFSLATSIQTASSQGVQQSAVSRLQSIWPSVRSSLKQELAGKLLKLSAANREKESRSNGSALATEILLSIRLSTDILNELLTQALASFESSKDSSAKRRRLDAGASTSSGSVHPHSTKGFSQLSLVLELIDASNTQADIRIFQNLFLALQAIQNYQIRSHVDADFLQVLTLNNLSSIAQSLLESPSKITLDQSIVRVDLLIECLRKTSNAQARNSTLKLLATLSRYIPQTVLQNVIPIFTLMSATAMRQEDEYSIHVVDQIIREVVPRLAETLRQQNSDLVSSVEDILWSFAAAFDHIPNVRRLRLYHLLATSLGPQDSLFAIIATLADRWSLSPGVERFLVSLLQHFSHNDVLISMRKYLELLLTTLWRPSSSKRSLLSLPSTESERDLKTNGWCSILPSMAKDGIDAKELRSSMSIGSTDQESHSLYAGVLKTLLQLTKLLENNQSSHKQCARTLEHLLRMPSFEGFLDAIEPLLADDDDDVAKAVLKSLEVQLRLPHDISNQAKQAALSFIPRLTHMVESKQNNALRLNAVVCVDRIIEDFGKLDLERTNKAAQVISKCAEDEDSLMRTLAFHCLASMAQTLQSQYIPLLQSTWQAICQGLDSSLAGTKKDTGMHSAALALALAIVENIAYVISPAALTDILKRLHTSKSANVGEDASESRNQLYAMIAEKVDVKIVFESAGQTFLDAVQQGPPALLEHLSLIQTSINLQPKSSISKHARTLLDHFLMFFDLRRHIDMKIILTHLTESQLNVAEQHIITSLLALVLKINDATFRPFFAQLVEWTTDLPKHEAAGVPHRQITLFNFTTTMSDRLKALVTTYATYLLDPAAHILRHPVSNPRSSPTSHRLTTTVLNTLTSTFHHDADDFFQTPARFSMLLPSLLTHLPLNNPVPNSSLTHSHLIPAITAFASAVSSFPGHLATLNTALLDFCKGKNPPVLLEAPVSSKDPTATRIEDRKQRTHAKLAAVMCMRALTRELGDEWLGMLPQMLPVVAELSEDGDERVEKETSAWVREMEGVLGESIRGMLG